MKLNEKTDVKKALDTALLCGFTAESAHFPIYTPGCEIDEVKDISPSALPENYTPAPKTGPVFSTEFRNKIGLEAMLSEGLFLHDTDNDFLPDVLDVKIGFAENPDAYTLAAAMNLAYRFGMETTTIEGSFYADNIDSDKVLTFTQKGAPEIIPGSENKVIINGSGEELLTFISSLCNTFPKIDPVHSWRDELMKMTDDLCMKTADGQLTYASRHDGEFTVFSSPDMTDEQKAYLPQAHFENHKAGKKVFSLDFEYAWEKDEFIRIFEENILPQLEKGDSLILEGAISEDAEIRKEVCEKITAFCADKGVNIEKLQLICSYKQGFSWIDEVVLPQLECKNVETITIYFKPFLPLGETEWKDENGATPSYNNVGGGDENKWLDLPIRYLQELYPIEDIIVNTLKIDRNAVNFAVLDTDEDITYAVEAGGMRFTYKAHASERPFMDEHKNMGKVHPSTGYIKALINGKPAFECDVKTDLERIWDDYQAHVLPAVKAYCEDKYPSISADDQPFFSKLELEISVSEPDYRLPSREDMISSLDALHEDMYFLGGDYFKNYGKAKCGQMFDAPGLILPVIHNTQGKPRFTATLYEQLAPQPCIVKDGEIIETIRDRDEISLFISRISYQNGLVFDISAQGVDESVIKAYAQLINDGIISKGVGTLNFVCDNGTFYTARPQVKSVNKCKNINDIELYESTLFSYETYLGVMEQLKEVEGIEVFEIARSYMGRKLYGVWFAPKHEGYLSLTKRLTRLPSEYINCRHHANEVSSTNAAFMLIKKLLTDEKYADIADKMNLVILPMENVDGTAIHYELQKEHPNWKLHVARFNAIGKEFSHDIFQKNTIHTEIMGQTRIYEKFVPDIVVDNHGVPSHEWEQQFSGYTSPSYKGFWLPRSLLYGYYWYVKNEEFAGNFAVNKRMEDVIADKIGSIDEMAGLNKEWSAQFEKYAHAWLPKLFPADYYKDMIDYWIPFDFDRNHRYSSIRFPWLTTVAYTSEVADETAQGEYLNLCARAHVAHDEATIDMILASRHVYDKHIDGKNMSAKYQRHRPMIV